MIGKQVGRYQIIEKLGEGGMGTVWRARDTQLLIDVALKLLPPQLADSPRDRERFMRGARAAARLDHRGIAKVLAADFEDNIPYLVTERIDGETIKQRTEARRKEPTDRQNPDWRLRRCASVVDRNGCRTAQTAAE